MHTLILGMVNSMEHWAIKIHKIYEEYQKLETSTSTPSLKPVSILLGISIGAVSEAVKICKNWEKVKHCDSRRQALETLSEPGDFDIISNESLNSVALHSDTSSVLRKFDNGTFNLLITRAEYLNVMNVSQIFRVMAKDSYAYFFSHWDSQERDRMEIRRIWRAIDYPIVWVNTSEYTNPRRHFYEITELILIGMKGFPRLAKESTNVFNFEGVSSTLKTAADEKPLKLVEELIKITLRTKGNILDPFCRSPEILMGARNLGHNYFGISRWEKDWDRVTRRLNKHGI